MSQCVYCGTKGYGSGCTSPKNPNNPKKHRFPSDGVKCIWCGSKGTNTGCSHNPIQPGKHQQRDY